MDCLFIGGEGYVPVYTRNDLTNRLHGSAGFRTDTQIVTKRQMKNVIAISKKSPHSRPEESVSANIALLERPQIAPSAVCGLVIYKSMCQTPEDSEKCRICARKMQVGDNEGYMKNPPF